MIHNANTPTSTHPLNSPHGKRLLRQAKHLAWGSALSLLVGAGTLVVSSSVAAQSFSGGERQMLDRVVAVVNDGAIMRSDLDRRLDQVISQISAQGEDAPSRRQLEQQVLEQMILEEIQLQMARNVNLSIDDTELNRQMRNIAESNGMTLQAFAERLEADGTSLAQVREEIRREMLTRQVQQRQVGQRVSVSNRDVERFLEEQGGDVNLAETRARHILVGVGSGRSEAQAQTLIEQAMTRLEQGESFATVAREMSDDQGSAVNGGDLGWLSLGQTVPEFDNAMNELEVGQVSSPVRSQFGYHIIEVLDRRRSSASNENVREQVRQAIFQRRANQEVDTWKREIREQAFVEKRL
ncbi:peptidylprolyl isomerase [Halomonas sp. TBZ9]|uniref:Peptidylprolyl isomerase n=1 Tax=Vreelandella azerica TaxID=2732867 RepID=A0A7Y3TXM3_9GAMM|nr:peptidylprolyl isomerase [Halomonas azerica]NOG31985.1 peptidylprolyl isomerase [Halomonas azerica]